MSRTVQYVRHDLIELAAAYAVDSILVTTAELDFPGPQILYANTAFARMTGYSLSEILGKTPRILHGPDTDRSTLQRLRQTLSQGDEFIGRTTNYKRDGTPFQVEWIIRPLKNSEGVTTHYIALQRELTQPHRTDDAIDQDQPLQSAIGAYQAMVQRLELREGHLSQRAPLAMVSEVVLGVLHDISNTLMPVFSVVDLMASIQDLPTELDEYVSLLETSSANGLLLLKNLKQVYSNSMSASGRRWISLKTLLSQIPDMAIPMCWKPDSKAVISFTLDLDDVPDIYGNAGELTQAFLNLASNSMDAMTDGGTVSIHLKQQDDRVCVRLRDTGPGIPDELVERVFEPFVSGKTNGSGLGLCICQRIIESHAGTVEVTKNSPGGLEITVCLPISQPAQEMQFAPRSRRILHVDHQPDRRSPLSALLRRMGHAVDTASSGDEGLFRYFQQPYDVVIAGTNLAPTNAYVVMQVLKRATPDVTFVISANHAEPVP
ncbi:MAG: PAS domain-containing protein, partial [Planctomycetales bacterium]|nr:PAS domain-containing protein [Planctomycetales bacterium]